MGNLIDRICKCRDILTKTPEKLRIYVGENGLFDQVADEIRRQLGRKAEDYSRELEFTHQDLIEFCYDIQGVLKKWETEMCPKRNIKQLLKTVEDGKLNMDPFVIAKTEVMALRRDCVAGLTRTLSILEYLAVYLYFIEDASKDEFALRITKRYKV